MEDEWIGRAVSIECEENLGIFQGTIKELSGTQIKIVRAFRNGVPLRNQQAEIVINCGDIVNLDILNTLTDDLSDSDVEPDDPPPPPSSSRCGASFKEPTSALTNKISTMKISSDNDIELRSSRHSNLVRPIPSCIIVNGHKISPPSLKIMESKVSSFVDPQKLSPATDKFFKLVSNGPPANPPLFMGIDHRRHRPLGLNLGQNTIKTAPIEILTSHNPDVPDVNPMCRSASKPIDISTLGKSAPVNSISSNNADGVSTLNGSKVVVCKPKKKYRRVADFNLLQTFGTPIDDSVMNEDFDFEGNLALFDKRAVWNTIEATRKPRPPKTTKKKSYRVDENILAGEPLDLRQISCGFPRAGDFVTDEGLIIPSIPLDIRSNIQKLSAAAGLSIIRQNDFLARGTTEVALMLLGGSRRLTPNNRHQWPTIAIICDSKRTGEVGASTGRQIASHGLQVIMYVLKNSMDDPNEKTGELDLFKATGNKVVLSVSEIHSPDLVILSLIHNTVPPSVKKWLSITRASVLAIDPPTNGVQEVQIKCSIFPILPLNHISINCGKVFLCNLGIPDTFFRDAGIMYKSPFGHKFVIQIYQKD